MKSKNNKIIVISRLEIYLLPTYVIRYVFWGEGCLDHER